MCESYIALIPNPKKIEIRTLNLSVFNVNMSKYDFYDVYLRGSSIVNTFLNSETSEFDPRGAVSLFQIILKFKKI